ncbi:CD3e molecule, epsilon associated protein [Pseudoliparis swirei]|uniref:CD3e molecule, epsilon associated protein n=1 Tax=Pseudoliparis swirei TaxID=2059687 RepID=UPI0024BE5599|nr:CD3e molecule, epsilon associated protein [Pseudoliparis swirei]
MPPAMSSSSSSSEGEEDSHPTESPVARKETDKKTSTYQCPDDFVPFCHKPCSSTLTESLKNEDNELWLIKAPASFNPECFSGIKVPLSGIQTLKVPTAPGGAKTGSGQQVYSVLASPHGTSELHLLTSDEPLSSSVVFGPAFSGLINVCENYGDSGANQAPQVIPATLPPSLPTGLKQRFHPFGSKTPTLTCVAESEVDGAALGPSSATLRPLVVKRFVEETWQEEEGRKGKKKKKKEKRIKTEVLDVAEVKVEPVSEVQEEATMGLPFQQGDASEETRKKKKKRKDREREEVEEGVEPSVKEEEVTVKCEPIDDSYGDVVKGRKKKKKKKSKTGDD